MLIRIFNKEYGFQLDHETETMSYGRESISLGSWSWDGPIACLCLAVLIWGFDQCKPPHADDNAYLSQARAIASDPSDPFGFRHRLRDGSVPGFSVLLPPAWPYVMGMTMRAGLPPKLAVLPLALLLVVSLRSILRRFSPSISAPLLWMIACGAAILPATNLMLDVPEITFALAAISVNQRACDRGSISLAAVAGALAGLAAQIKYNGVIVPAILALQSLVFRRPTLAVTSSLAWFPAFFGLELAFSAHSGSSHALYHLAHPGERQGFSTKAIALVTSIGGLIPFLPVIALMALGSGRRLVQVVAGVIPLALVGLSVVAILPNRDSTLWLRSDWMRPPLEAIVFGLLGLLTLGTLAIAAIRLLRVDGNRDGDRPGVFLVGWIVLEILGYFALSPFAASRRYIGLAMALSIFFGRMAQVPDQSPDRLRRITLVSVMSVCWGVLVASIDLEEATATSIVTRQGAIFARNLATKSGGKAYVSTELASDLIAADEGLDLLTLDGPELRPGDTVLIVGGDYIAHPDFPPEAIREEYAASIAASVPLTTFPCYYSGSWPIQRFRGARALVSVLQILKPCHPTRRTTHLRRSGVSQYRDDLHVRR